MFSPCGIDRVAKSQELLMITDWAYLIHLIHAVFLSAQPLHMRSRLTFDCAAQVERKSTRLINVSTRYGLARHSSRSTSDFAMVRDKEKLLVIGGRHSDLKQRTRRLIKVYGYLHKEVHDQETLELFRPDRYLADKYLGRNAFAYFDDYM